MTGMASPPPVTPESVQGPGPDERPRQRLASADYSVIAVSSLLILSLWTGLHFYAALEREQTLRSAEINLANYARAFGEHSARTARVLDQTTLFIKHEYEHHGGNIDLEQYIARGAFLDQFFNMITIAGEDGSIKLFDRDLPQSNIRDREHFQVHVATDSGMVHISKPVLGRSSGKWSIEFTRRINKPDGSFGGVVVASLDPGYFTQFYKAVEFGHQGTVALIGTDGYVRARHSELSAETGQDLRGAELFRQLAAGDHGSFRSTSIIDGIRRIYSYRWLKEYPLVVAVGMGESEILSAANQQIAVLRMMGGIITLLILIASAALLILLRKQREVEESLRRSGQTALESSRLKSEFLVRMSHELRTPLNGILGYAEYLKDRATDREQREFAGTIHQAGQHLLALVNATLDLARIEAGKMEVKWTVESPRDLVDSAVTLHQPTAAGKGLSLQAEYAPGVPEKITCDATKVMQVLNNLIHNAVKFTDRGGVTVRVEARDSEILISVSDTGPGIPVELQSQLFDRFRQLDSFTTRSHEGSGLGLALARDLVELMGGRIGLRSAVGTGSTFHFTLPLGRS